MDVIGSEIGYKMRSAIKAKLTEIGCYVDDELPDYVMVMVANKRTRLQMEEDLNLFLGDNTSLFVGWLHQVLKKLQEVSITNVEKSKGKSEKSSSSSKKKEKDSKKKSKSSKEKSVKLNSKVSKDSKDKDEVPKVKKEKKHKLKDEIKKAKRELKKKKEKIKKKKHSKKKRKPKETEMIRPNIPPLLMNLEKESEPSITDVFAGQILKNHGILVETREKMLAESETEVKPIRRVSKLVIDPETVTSIEPGEGSSIVISQSEIAAETQALAAELASKPRDEQIKEMNEIQHKIQGLKKKLADQLDNVMSDDEDFLNIRTEAEELMGDFEEDLLPDMRPKKSKKTPTSPIRSTSPIQVEDQQKSPPISLQSSTLDDEIVLPQIELNLPKRPVRERLGTKMDDTSGDKEFFKNFNEESLTQASKEDVSEERLTPPLELAPRASVRDRLGESVPAKSWRWRTDEEELQEENLHRQAMTSQVSIMEKKQSRGPTSVVRVRPRPRPTSNTGSALLMKAMADAHKSLIEIPPKVEKEAQPIKRALVLPMRRTMEPQKIVVQVQSDKINTNYNSQDSNSEYEIDIETESLESEGKNSRVSNEYIPEPVIRKPIQTKVKYVPTLRFDVDSTNEGDSAEETINIHAASTGKGPTFVVTLDGLDPNVFLAKKLKNEGLLDDESELKPSKTRKESAKVKSSQITLEKNNDKSSDATKEQNNVSNDGSNISIAGVQSEKVETFAKTDTLEARREKSKAQLVESVDNWEGIRKRKASPIVFNMPNESKKEKKEENSKNDPVVLKTAPKDSKKFERLPSLPLESRPTSTARTTCRSFPLCKFGSACAFTHPLCKFGTACTKRDCPYSHPEISPALSSHVVPASSFKTITSATMKSICKYYPNCVNTACHFFHPKLCRFGKNCINKLECNFYHHEVPAAHKWKAANYST